jgi:hypothetical protein
VKAYVAYVDRLERLLFDSSQTSELKHKAAIEAALNGQPSAELRRCIPIARLRSAGAFFTGSSMARRAIATGLGKLPRDAKILDPACGVGDLLVAVTELLPWSSDLTSTLADWGGRILGRDLQPEFVRATKVRLALAAIQRAQFQGAAVSRVRELFPGLASGCSLAEKELFESASHIVINPPFTLIPAPRDCEWASGRVNSAAVFMDRCVSHSQAGARIIAILPEVLRSGSRYEKWRKLFEKRVSLAKVEVVGQFDRHTDVDVFIAVGILRKPSGRTTSAFNWARPQRTSAPTIGEKFDVSVGPVVPYRDPRHGRWHPFIHARDLPAWSTVASVAHHRRFAGRTYDSPFVVVRRTSRPGDKHRAVGTIVNVSKAIAVENHLLVLEPKDRSLAKCKRLVKLLHGEGTNEMLNRRIRCRHLTVSSLTELPWSEK